MGAAGSKPTDSKAGTEEQKSFSNEKEDKRQHPNMLNKKIIKRDEEEQAQIEVTVPSEKQYKNWDANVKILEQSEFAFAPLSHKFKSLSYCGSSGGITINYQHFPFLLCDQIANRILQNNHRFLETEIWYLLYALLDVSRVFHSNNKKIGDVRPQNIFIDQYGTVKISTIYTFPMEVDNFAKTRLNEQITYLAPEEMKEICFGELQSKCDASLAETFSVGLTCLDAMNLSFSKELYGTKFNYEKLDTKINQLRNIGQYSDQLKWIVELMCETDSQYRPSCLEIFKWISPYKHQINDLQAFHPDFFKPKNQKQSRNSFIASTKKNINKTTNYMGEVFLNKNQRIKQNSLFQPLQHKVADHFESNRKMSVNNNSGANHFIAPHQVSQKTNAFKIESQSSGFTSNPVPYQYNKYKINNQQPNKYKSTTTNYNQNVNKTVGYKPIITFNKSNNQVYAPTNQNQQKLNKIQNKLPYLDANQHNLQYQIQTHSNYAEKIEQPIIVDSKNAQNAFKINQLEGQYSYTSADKKQKSPNKSSNFIQKNYNTQSQNVAEEYVSNEGSRHSFKKIQQQLKRSRQMFPS